MYKTQLIDRISDLLHKAIEAHEATDLCLGDRDDGALSKINSTLSTSIQYLRKARRASRILAEEYEENLDIKPEYLEKGKAREEAWDD
jgi:hypothetical protein